MSPWSVFGLKVGFGPPQVNPQIVLGESYVHEGPQRLNHWSDLPEFAARLCVSEQVALVQRPLVPRNSAQGLLVLEHLDETQKVPARRDTNVFCVDLRTFLFG